MLGLDTGTVPVLFLRVVPLGKGKGVPFKKYINILKCLNM